MTVSPFHIVESGACYESKALRRHVESQQFCPQSTSSLVPQVYFCYFFKPLEFILMLHFTQLVLLHVTMISLICAWNFHSKHGKVLQDPIHI